MFWKSDDTIPLHNFVWQKESSLAVCTLCTGIFAFKMTTEIICLQHELPIVLISTLDLETFIKGHHVYKDIWTQKQGEQLDEFKWTNSQYVWILMKKLLNRLMTQALGQKLLVKGVILAMKRECKKKKWFEKTNVRFTRGSS